MGLARTKKTPSYTFTIGGFKVRIKQLISMRGKKVEKPFFPFIFERSLTA
jgi:hypothetical protein